MIKWVMTGNDPADLKAEPAKGDMLRVERMTANCWWFACYIGEKRYEDDPNTAGSKKEAKGLCEELYKKNKDADKL